MLLSEILSEKKQLELNGEVVEGAYIVEAPLSELIKFQEIEKEEDLTLKLELCLNLIKNCLVDVDGNKILKDGVKLSNAYIMDVASFIMEANMPEGKSILEDDESVNI